MRDHPGHLLRALATLLVLSALVTGIWALTVPGGHLAERRALEAIAEAPIDATITTFSHGSSATIPWYRYYHPNERPRRVNHLLQQARAADRPIGGTGFPKASTTMGVRDRRGGEVLVTLVHDTWVPPDVGIVFHGSDEVVHGVVLVEVATDGTPASRWTGAAIAEHLRLTAPELLVVER